MHECIKISCKLKVSYCNNVLSLKLSFKTTSSVRKQSYGIRNTVKMQQNFTNIKDFAFEFKRQENIKCKTAGKHNMYLKSHYLVSHTFE